MALRGVLGVAVAAAVGCSGAPAPEPTPPVATTPVATTPVATTPAPTSASADPVSASPSASPPSPVDLGPAPAPEPEPPQVAALAEAPEPVWSVDATAGAVFAIDAEHVAMISALDDRGARLEVSLLNLADGSAVWTTELEADSFQTIVRPFAGADLIIVHSDEHLYLLNLADGKVAESYTTTANSWYGTSADGTAWYLSEEGSVMTTQLSKLTGHDPADAAWTTKLVSPPSMVREVAVTVRGELAHVSEAFPPSVSVPYVSDYSGPFTESVGAFTVADGSIPDWARGSRLTSIGDLVAGRDASRALTARRGSSELWEAAGQAISAAGCLFTSDGATLRRVDPETGQAFWDVPVASVQRVASVGDSIATVSYDPGAQMAITTVNLLDPATGEVLGKQNFTLGTIPILWRGTGQLLLSTRGDEVEKLYAIAADGSITWEYETPQEAVLASAGSALFEVTKATITRLG